MSFKHRGLKSSFMPDSLFIGGFEFYKNSTRNGTEYYKCRHFRTSKCPAHMIKRNNDVHLRGDHSCNLPTRQALVDSFEWIERFLDMKSKDVMRYPSEIYADLLRETEKNFQGEPVKIPSKRAVAQMIRSRRPASTELLSLIQKPPLSQTKSGRPFLRRFWYGDIDGVFEQVAIWASDEGLALLRMDGQTFLDATF
jgi:hypothetical protein